MSRRSFGHIRKLPSKKFQASFVGLDGERVNAPHTFLTKGDASAWLSAEEVKQSKGIPQPTRLEAEFAEPSPKFETYVERHIALQTTSSGSLLRVSTQNLYRRLLRVNLKVFWGKPINKIRPSEVSEWWASCIASGKKTSASKAYKLMSAAMRRAVTEGLIKSNPCSVKGAQGAISGKSVGVPTLDQVKALANNINPRFSAMVLLMAFGGFRFGEVTELRRGDVREISVHGRRAYCFQVERAVTLVNTGKSKCIHHIDKPKSAASVREVVVTSSLTAKIDELLESLPESEEALLFPAASGSDVHLRHDVFMNAWRPAMVRASIPAGSFSPHGLRHFAGTHLHMAGATIAELKEWLGDSSTAAVMRYVHSTGRTPGIADKMAKQEDFA